MFRRTNTIQSNTVGKDEGHVVHLLYREIVSIRMVDVQLKDVHTGTRAGVYVRFSSRSREEKHLHSERNEDNCNNSDGVMGAHLICSSSSCYPLFHRCFTTGEVHWTVADHLSPLILEGHWKNERSAYEFINSLRVTAADAPRQGVNVYLRRGVSEG